MGVDKIIDKVIDHLYITGGIGDASQDAIIQLKIDALVLVAKDVCCQEYCGYMFPLLDAPISDKNPISGFKYAVECIINLLKEDKNVLVSCKGGLSRSSIVCICVLHDMGFGSWDDCEKKLREVHPQSKLLNKFLYSSLKEFWCVHGIYARTYTPCGMNITETKVPADKNDAQVTCPDCLREMAMHYKVNCNEVACGRDAYRVPRNTIFKEKTTCPECLAWIGRHK